MQKGAAPRDTQLKVDDDEVTTTTTTTTRNVSHFKQLMVDSWLIDTAAQNGTTTIQVNRAADPVTWIEVLSATEPWEIGCRVAGTSVLRETKDGNDLIRMWYVISSCPGNWTVLGEEWNMAAYAESTDGIHFKKPDLGLVAWRNSSRTNLVALGHHTWHSPKPCMFCFNVFLDPRSSQRYKSCNKIHSSKFYGEKWGPFACASSQDGFNWSYLTTLAIGDADSQANFVYDTLHQRWNMFHRLWIRQKVGHASPHNHRCVRRLIAPSPLPLDAEGWLPQNATYNGSWAEGEGKSTCDESNSKGGDCGQAVVMCPDTTDEVMDEFASADYSLHPPPVDYYGATIWPVPQTKTWLMFPMRMWHYRSGGTVDNTSTTTAGIVTCTDFSQKDAIGTCDPATKEPGLAVSRDSGASFRFVGPDRGLSVLGTGYWGDDASMTTWLIPAPIEQDKRLLIYFYGTNTNEDFHADPLAPVGDRSGYAADADGRTSTFLALTRLDGLASLDVTGGYGARAVVLTKPLLVGMAQTLVLNIDTLGIGSLEVELCDHSGIALPGYERRNALSFAGANTLRGQARWRGAKLLSAMRTTATVRLRFYMLAPCKIFSFQFKTDDVGESSKTCHGELLSNGICLPQLWPPAANFSSVLKPPGYLLNPPALINISHGRQLFVDSFLLASTNAVTQYHSGDYAPENPVLQPDQPWEKVNLSSSTGYGDTGPYGTAMPFSGGVWYFNESFHLWYNCGGGGNTPPLSNTCYATSTDGKNWTKPPFNAGTNTVRGSARKDGNTVWLDRRDPNPERRFKIAEVRSSQKYRAFTLLQSADGKDWTIIKNATGPIQDRSTMFFNPFREKWVYTNKVSGAAYCDSAWCKAHNKDKVSFGRSHAYFESKTKQICEWTPDGTCTKDSAAWTEMYSMAKPREPRPWVVADEDDPRLLMPNGTSYGFADQLYNLDVTAYESLLVGSFSVLQCKHADNKRCPGPESGHEFNSVFLGWSRDGFHWHRPPKPRTAFAPLNLEGCAKAGHPAPKEQPYSFANCTTWNYEDVQSSAGGWIVFDDKLYSYVSGRSNNQALDQTGLLTVRRDGFAALTSTVSGKSFALTRVLHWTPTHKFMFVNFKGLNFKVSVLDAAINATIEPFAMVNSIPITTDSTRIQVQWKDAPKDGLAGLQGRAVRFHFEWESGSFYSFWLSESSCGASYGFLDGGGAGIDDSGVDTKGSCTSLKSDDTDNTGLANVKNFGAFGDGIHDDGPAIQMAIEAVRMQEGTVLFPSGTYVVNSTLIAGPHRLWLTGNGRVSVAAGQPMVAVLTIDGAQPNKTNGGGTRSNEITVSGISFDGRLLADFAVFAPAITRSRFSTSEFNGGLIAGLYVGYGWINEIFQCKFSGSGLVGLWFERQCNANNIIDSSFEGFDPHNGLPGIGLLLQGEGSSVRVEGNTFEGLGGPGIIANNINGLAVRSNYFEENNLNVSKYNFVEQAGKQLASVCTDILINGDTSGSLALDAFANRSRGMRIVPGPIVLSAQAPTLGVTISNNFHNPNSDQCVGNTFFGTFAAGVAGLVSEANTCVMCADSYKVRVCEAVGGNNKTLSKILVQQNVGFSSKEDQ
jgi:hypothetical protein